MAAKLPDISVLVQAGINPKTGLPYKFGDSKTTKSDIKRFLRIIDEQDAINRYEWTGIPCNLSSQEIERLIYYKYNLAFFYFKELDEFFFMPFALDGTIDFYGRYNYIHPVPMASGKEEEQSRAYKDQTALLSTMRFKVIYGPLTETPTFEEACGYAVILRDYTNQLSQMGVARQVLDDVLLDAEADCIPFMHTNLLNSTGIMGMRVQDADQQEAVKVAALSVEKAALVGEPWIPIIGDLDFQELTGAQVAKSEEYMLALQSIDNFRLRGLGIENGGVFEKKAHILDSENQVNNTTVSTVFQDGLSQRQNFCNIVNSIFGIGLWCEPSETQMGDMDGDMFGYDENYDGSSSGMDDYGGGE